MDMNMNMNMYYKMLNSKNTTKEFRNKQHCIKEIIREKIPKNVPSINYNNTSTNTNTNINNNTNTKTIENQNNLEDSKKLIREKINNKQINTIIENNNLKKYVTKKGTTIYLNSYKY